MLSLKVTVRLIAMMMLLSIGFVVYPQGSANAAKFCAELRGQPPPGTLIAHSRRFTRVARTSRLGAADTATNCATRQKW